MAAPTRRVRVLPSAEILLVHVEEGPTQGRRAEDGGQAHGLPIHPDLRRTRHGIHGCGHMLPLVEVITLAVERNVEPTRWGWWWSGRSTESGRLGGAPREPFAHEGIAPGKSQASAPRGDLRLDPGIQGGVGAEAIEHRRIRDIT